MKSYTIVYFRAYGYDVSDKIICERCNERIAVDISHIFPKGTFNELKDRIEIIMASCRECHNEYGDLPRYRDENLIIHKENMIQHGVKFDEAFINDLIQQWEEIRRLSN